MFRHSLKTRLLAMFVVAFICLNAGGAVCVAYCRTSDSVAVETEHCPLKKVERHCDKSADDGGTAAFAGHEMDCCPMTVSFFGAPIEKPSFHLEPATSAVVSTTQFLQPAFTIAVERVYVANYRGPPLLDRRSDRIKNRILRI